MRAYYNKTKKPIECPHCNGPFSCKGSLNYHLKNNVTCKILLMADICETEKGKDLLEVIRKELIALASKMGKGGAANNSKTT
jgi:hypothetical protein